MSTGGEGGMLVTDDLSIWGEGVVFQRSWKKYWKRLNASQVMDAFGLYMIRSVRIGE